MRKHAHAASPSAFKERVLWFPHAARMCMRIFIFVSLSPANEIFIYFSERGGAVRWRGNLNEMSYLIVSPNAAGRTEVIEEQNCY